MCVRVCVYVCVCVCVCVYLCTFCGLLYANFNDKYVLYWLIIKITNVYIFTYTQLNSMYKIGLLYCKYGQSLEEEMYNNGMCVPLYVCMCFCVCTCVYVHAVYMCAFVCIHMHVCIYTCTCVYVCVLFVCTIPLKGNVALTRITSSSNRIHSIA